MNKVTTELTEYMSRIEAFNKDLSTDTDVLYSYMIELTAIMARANYLMAFYRKQFREEKKAAYDKLITGNGTGTTQKFLSPSVVKEYVDSQCSETAYTYDLAERLSRLSCHTIDAARTIISSIKVEKQAVQYSRPF